MAKTSTSKEGAHVRHYFLRAQKLDSLFGLGPIEHLSLFPCGSALEYIEYILHELSHSLTMGFRAFPSSHTRTAVQRTLENLSEKVNDQLEIETTYVTYRAMARLGLVDHDKIVEFATKCADALTGKHSERVYYVLDVMEDCAEDEALRDCQSVLHELMTAPLQALKRFLLTPSERENPLRSIPA